MQRVKVDYRRTFSGHFSRKTPERHQKRPSCAPVFPTKFPLAPTLAPKCQRGVFQRRMPKAHVSRFQSRSARLSGVGGATPTSAHARGSGCKPMIGFVPLQEFLQLQSDCRTRNYRIPYVTSCSGYAPPTDMAGRTESETERG